MFNLSRTLSKVGLLTLSPDTLTAIVIARELPPSVLVVGSEFYQRLSTRNGGEVIPTDSYRSKRQASRTDRRSDRASDPANGPYKRGTLRPLQPYLNAKTRPAAFLWLLKASWRKTQASRAGQSAFMISMDGSPGALGGLDKRLGQCPRPVNPLVAEVPVEIMQVGSGDGHGTQAGNPIRRIPR